VVSNIVFDFPYIGNGTIIPTDELTELIFFRRGWWLNHQPEYHDISKP
jgi:hypothetical protein